ncbi:DUF6711 family protein [Paenibacillus sp. FSL L8-0708]|uniref:DUF6711 family protein n=1 Tax=Paenibacillus sp. FSL L8-0708 TaxID=2975311 RepID=UPI0030F75596
MIKINGTTIAASPATFVPTLIDLDDGESSIRTADGKLHRDRIRVMRQLDMTFGILNWAEMSALMKSMADSFFSVTYPDPMSGVYETRKFYVGNRNPAFAVAKGNDILWSGLKITLTEQ